LFLPILGTDLYQLGAFILEMIELTSIQSSCQPSPDSPCFNPISYRQSTN